MRSVGDSFSFYGCQLREKWSNWLDAVLLNGTGKVLGWFGMCWSQEQLAPFPQCRTANNHRWTWDLGSALSLLVWQSLPESVHRMVYIDNEGAKYSLIKDYSTSRAITALCAWAATTLDTHFCATMFARVPSISNIADYPSRQLEHPLSVKDTMIPMKK